MILSIGPSGMNFSEVLLEIHSFSFKKIHLKMSSGKWRPLCLGVNVLIKHCRDENRGCVCTATHPTARSGEDNKPTPLGLWGENYPILRKCHFPVRVLSILLMTIPSLCGVIWLFHSWKDSCFKQIDIEHELWRGHSCMMYTTFVWLWPQPGVRQADTGNGHLYCHVVSLWMLKVEMDWLLEINWLSILRSIVSTEMI